MKFIIKSADRINIYMTKEDLAQKNLNAAELFSDYGCLKKQLSEIFRKIRQETGFVCDDASLVIDVIPIIGGDLLLSIAKGHHYIQNMCFEFAELEDLFTACGQFTCIPEKSSVYKYCGKYFLVTPVIGGDTYVISEYGRLSPLRPEVIIEHGAALIKVNAVETIRKYFS